MSKKRIGPCKGGDDCIEDGHLCKIIKRGNLDRIRDIVRDSRFFCMKCGRAAHDEISLCKPARI